LGRSLSHATATSDRDYQRHLPGFAVDGDSEKSVFLFKQVGKVIELRKKVEAATVNKTLTFLNHGGMAHTRWYVCLI
jgi:glucosamine 6-phosphate synthetase-like amidotransferase/phosphosugar isomerase protein